MDFAPPKALVLDGDGLFFDSERPARVAWLQGAEELRMPLTAEFCGTLIGRNSADIAQKLNDHFKDESAVRDLRERAMKIYLDLMASGLSLMPGGAELIEAAETLEIHCAMATSSSRRGALEKLNLVGYAERFQVVTTGDEVKHGKPHPEIFLTAVQRLGLTPGECWACEDSNLGVESAHGAGIPTWMVPDLVEPTEESRLRATVVTSLHEVVSKLRSFA